MPNQDGTGPMGQGPLTGRGLGPCGRGLARGRVFARGFGAGRGFARGFGTGRGFGWRFAQGATIPAQPLPAEQVELSKSEQRKVLKAELEELKQEEKEIKEMLADLE